jgi:hypothetical protein
MSSLPHLVSSTWLTTPTSAGQARCRRTVLSSLLPSEFITHGFLYDVMLPSLGSRSAWPTSAGPSLCLCLSLTPFGTLQSKLDCFTLYKYTSV